METVRVENMVAMETAAPKRRVVRSDGALYALLLVAVIGVIVAGNALSYRWNLPRLFVQLTLYALLLAGGYLVYRYCLVSFRYTLTERMLQVERLVGRKTRAEENVHLSDVTWIRPYAENGSAAVKPRGLYTGKRADALAVQVSLPAGRYTLLVSPTEEFAEKLISQWKTVRK